MQVSRPERQFVADMEKYICACRRWNLIGKAVNAVLEFVVCLFLAHCCFNPNIIASLNMIGIPCMHACACIYSNNEDPNLYVDKCYSTVQYKEVYSHVINPLNSPSLWEKVKHAPRIIIAPSPVKVKRGRRRTIRRKKVEELEKRAQDKAAKKKSKQKMKLTGVMTVKYSVCGQLGYNKRHYGDKASNMSF